MNRRLVKAIILFVAGIIDIIIFFTINNFLFALLLAFYVFMFAKLLCNYRNNAIMLAFLICFFVFLMGRPFAYEVLGYSRSSGLKIDEEAMTCTYLCLLISLMALFCGYYICKKIKFHKKEKNRKANRSGDNVVFRENLKKISLYATIVTYILAIAENVLRFVYVRRVGYGASYYLEHDFAYGMPFVLHALAMCAPVALAIFLATLPSKKEARLPMVLFLVSNLASSMSGNRFEIIASILAVVVYCLWRTNLDKEKWISRKFIIAMIVLSPVLVLVMQGVANWRNGSSMMSTDSNPIVSFIYENGGSSYQIGAVQQYKGVATDENVLYSFGGVWRGMQGSDIAKMAGANESYKTQTVAYAKNAHSLAAALTYYFFPTQYLAGYGLGGCYIAELYHDFSFFGVIMGNLLIGFLIGMFSGLKRNKIVRNFLSFFAIMLFLRLPRDSFMYPLLTLVNLRNVLFIFGIYLISKYLTNRQERNARFLSMRQLRKEQIENE